MSQFFLIDLELSLPILTHHKLLTAGNFFGSKSCSVSFWYDYVTDLCFWNEGMQSNEILFTFLDVLEMGNFFTFYYNIWFVYFAAAGKF